MHCYNHADTPAVGICKFCNKGICAACAHDLAVGLSCMDHEAEVHAMHEVFLMHSRSTQNVKRTYNGLALIMLVCGVVFILWGFALGNPFIIPIGAVTIAFASLLYTLGKRIAVAKA